HRYRRRDLEPLLDPESFACACAAEAGPEGRRALDLPRARPCRRPGGGRLAGSDHPHLETDRRRLPSQSPGRFPDQRGGVSNQRAHDRLSPGAAAEDLHLSRICTPIARPSVMGPPSGEPVRIRESMVPVTERYLAPRRKLTCGDRPGEGSEPRE